MFSFLRHYLGNGRSVLVALNMSDKPQMVTYDLTSQGVTGGIGLMLLEQLRLREQDDPAGPHDDPAVRDRGHRGEITARLRG